MTKRTNIGTSITGVPEDLISDVRAIVRSKELTMQQAYQAAMLHLSQRIHQGETIKWVQIRPSDAGRRPFAIWWPPQVSRAIRDTAARCDVYLNVFFITAMREFARNSGTIPGGLALWLQATYPAEDDEQPYELPSAL